jgi:NADH:ubiquinone oxidoreductase subunit E
MDTQNSEVYTNVAALLQDIPRDRAQLLPALWRVVERYQELTHGVLEAVSQSLGIPYAEVFGVASFYTLFDNETGKTPVYICTDVMCALQGAQSLKDAAEAAALGNPVSVRESACLGQCDHAPAGWFGGEVITRATSGAVAAAVKEGCH